MRTYTEQRQVDCEDGQITYLLTRKPVKNVNLRIKTDGRILVSASRNVSIDFIEGFIRRKQKYIFSVLAEFEKVKQPSEDVPRQYVSGERYDLLGKSFQLIVEESSQETVYSDDAYIYLRVGDKEDIRRKERMLTKWFKEYQLTVFKELIDKEYKVFQKYGVPYPELKIRYMTTRWGSCRPRKGSITLNSCLIEMPYECIEYVVVHEFAHFIHPNHSSQFWDFVTMMMPDWKERRAKLEKR